MSSGHFIRKCTCGTVFSECRCPAPDKPVETVKNGCMVCMSNPKPAAQVRQVTVQHSIVDLALAKLQYEDLCPDVGMEMPYWMALDEVLKEHHLTKNDVPYDELLEEIRAARKGR
jgi:hypothetical protein